MILKNKGLIIAAYAYLLLPVMLFLFGWLRPLYSTALALLLAGGLYRTVRGTHAYRLAEKSPKKMRWVILLTLAWVALSGVGGLAWQNRWDHMFRNALFNDLVAFSWPVKNFEMAEPRALIYYIGFWLPGAAFAKLFGLQAGYFFQFLYGVMGVLLALLLLFERLGKVSIKATLLFMLYSGLDIIPYLHKAIQNGDPAALVLRNLALGRHLELAIHTFNSSSNTTLLYWLYNQILPFWVGMLLLWRLRDNAALLFTFALLLLFAPFPAAALAPVLVMRTMSNAGFTKGRIKQGVIAALRSLMTAANVTGALLMLVLGLYYVSNRAVSNLSILPFTAENMGKFWFYLSIEFAVFIPFLWKRIRRDASFWCLFLTTVVCSFIRLGNDHDFAWRTCIPFAFYLMLLMMEEVQNMNPRALRGKLLLAVFVLGAFTPGMEMLRVAEQTGRVFIGRSHEPFLSGGLKSVFDENDCYDNFVGSGDSFFFVYLAK